MTTAQREFWWDIAAGSSSVLAFVSYIELGKIYHGYYGLTLADLLPLSYLMASWIALALWHRLHQPPVVWLSRTWLWMSLLIGLLTRYGALLVATSGRPVAAASAVLFIILGLALATRLPAQAWAGLRRVTALIPWLVVISPLVASQWLAPQSLIWLDKPTHTPPPRTATIVLLLDEMNANATQGLQDILRQRGLTVSFKPVTPVHGSTTEVVPALFSDEDYKGARACGPRTVCTEHAALAFDHIHVLRPDVDVVGFHHAYCDIKGLRYCKRLTTQRSIWENHRWICTLNRLTQSNFLSDASACQEAAHRTWADLRSNTIDALMAAPALTTGGVLYAHLPLPHPPSRGTGTLSDQYMRNVQQTEQLLTRVMDQLEAQQLEPRILIFADHPLRQSMWCANESAQFDQPCEVNPKLEDDQVPLLLAGRSILPSLEQAQSNKSVFPLLRQWLNQ